MSTGHAHYREAERLLSAASEDLYGASSYLATAQVHATLALAATTALGNGHIEFDDTCSCKEATAARYQR